MATVKWTDQAKAARKGNVVIVEDIWDVRRAPQNLTRKMKE